jgi:hypothetical protein
MGYGDEEWLDPGPSLTEWLSQQDAAVANLARPLKSLMERVQAEQQETAEAFWQQAPEAILDEHLANLVDESKTVQAPWFRRIEDLDLPLPECPPRGTDARTFAAAFRRPRSTTR